MDLEPLVDIGQGNLPGGLEEKRELISHLLEIDSRVSPAVAALIAAARIAYETPCEVAYWKATQLLRRYSALLGESVNQADKMARQLRSIPLLVIDDLGKEKLTGRGEELIFELMDERLYSRNPRRVTWISSNCGAGEIERKFGNSGPYLAARLREMCKVWDADSNREIKN